VRGYPASLPDVLAQFGGEDYNDDLARLKSLLGNLGCALYSGGIAQPRLPSRDFSRARSSL
jgi:hypothetical protein